ncbi:MAG: hypothetical protein R6U32_03445 [Candidatus Woesearchaeota archaeon]
MKQFINVVKEVKSTLAGITIFFILLDSVIIFLVVYLLLSLFELYPTASLIPALFYFIYSLYQETKLNKIRVVEKFYPELNEKLRTAVDYAGVKNDIVDNLHQDVISGMRKVAASSFFNRKETFQKVAVIVALCFVIIGVTFLGISFAAFKGKLADVAEGLGDGGGDAGDETGDISETTGGGAAFKDIYGEKSVANLGDKEVEMEMKTSSYEFIVRESGEIEDEEEFQEQFPEDITSVESKNYDENIPDERDQQELIKNYFKRLATG